MVLNENPCVVRRLGAEDVELFKHLRLEALRYEPDSFASRLEDEIELSLEDWLKRLQDITVFGVFDKSVAFGIMGLISDHSVGKASQGSLVMVYIQKLKRRTGAASLMLKEVIKFASETNISQLKLCVNAENTAAERFYSEEGFVEIERTQGANKCAGNKNDELVMVRALNPA